MEPLFTCALRMRTSPSAACPPGTFRLPERICARPSRHGRTAMERNMSGKTILKIATAGLVGATLIGTDISAIAAPMGIAPKAAVTAPSQIDDVQWRRWGGGGWGYRRGWGGGWGWGAPALGAAIGLGVLGAAAAASTPYYYGYPAYGYG